MRVSHREHVGGLDPGRVEQGIHQRHRVAGAMEAAQVERGARRGRGIHPGDQARLARCECPGVRDDARRRMPVRPDDLGG